MILQKLISLLLVASCQGFTSQSRSHHPKTFAIYSTTDEVGPLDYDPDTLLDPTLKSLAVDTNVEDASIREELDLVLTSTSHSDLVHSSKRSVQC